MTLLKCESLRFACNYRFFDIFGQNEINIDSGQFKGADSENDTPKVQKSKVRLQLSIF